MKVLLDTHSLLWAVFNDPRLSATAIAALRDPSTEVYVSAASAYEIATRFRIGKLPNARALVEEFEETLERAGYFQLPISVRHGIQSGSFSASHPDPFDRMLAAQSLTENMPLLSNDLALDRFGVRRLW